MKHLFLIFLLFIFCQVKSQDYKKADIKLIEKYIFEKTNKLREKKRKTPFIKNDSLNFLAIYHSRNMVKYKFYSHIDHQGLSPVKRAEKNGIVAWRWKGNKAVGISENIARVPWHPNVKGCGDTQNEKALAECIVQGWRKSPPHYKNIMSNALFLGVGIAFDKKGVFFATQNFR